MNVNRETQRKRPTTTSLRENVEEHLHGRIREQRTRVGIGVGSTSNMRRQERGERRERETAH